MNLDNLILHPRTAMFAEKITANLPNGLIIEGPVGGGVVAVAKSIADRLGSPSFVLLPRKKVRGELTVDLDDGSIIIEDIRQLYQQTCTKQPGQSVYIIDTGGKSMTIGAQNAFLKLLEEPRNGVHFIIATHQFDQLLSTIASRCQRLTLLPINDDQTNELIDSLSITDQTKRTRLAFVGRGRPALIRRLAADDKLYEARVKIMSDAKTMLGANTYDKMTVVHAYRESRADALTLLDDMNLQLQIVLRSQPEKRHVKEIDRNLEARRRIAAGGNIRSQLITIVI